ncbi:START domain-containing protein [Aquabacterium sp.]|uniref:START domain-containing protein n=1 Tax=Aquabacterium sp. TaxID=1872578 RepID=UPI0035ADD2BF
MRSFRAWCVAGLMLLLGGAAQAADNWEVIRQGGAGREDIASWVRPVQGMSVKAFRGVTEIHANAYVLLAVLADTRNLSNWIYQGQFSEHPANLPPDNIYMRFNGIWPASDRDVLFRTTVTQDGEAVVVESNNVDGMAVNSSYVRVAKLHNTFRLVPLKGGWTRVEFETLVDLGGMVPSWLANLVSTKAPLVTLQGMQQQAKKPAYQGKTGADLPQQYSRDGRLVLPEWHLKGTEP